MARYYIQEGESTNIFWLDVVNNVDVGLPTNDYRLRHTLMDGGQIKGVGAMQGRVFECTYFFKQNDDYERELFLDWFSRPLITTLYLYKYVYKRVKCSITNGSTIVILGSTQGTNQLSTGDPIYGLGLSSASSAVIDSINSTYLDISVAATDTLVNTHLQADTFLGRTKVVTQPEGGEAYGNIRISDDVSFKAISGSPYFTSTTLNTFSTHTTSSTEFQTTFTLDGFRTPCQYEMTPSTNMTVFQVKTADGYGFKASKTSFLTGEVVNVDTTGSDLKCTVDDNEVFNVFSAESTPFSLERGSNTLSVIAQESTDTAFKVKYYERQL